MTSNAFMPNTDSGKADLLDHVATILPRYAALLEVTNEYLADLQADALAFRYILKSMVDMQAYAHHLTEFKIYYVMVAPLLWAGLNPSPALSKDLFKLNA